MAKTRSYKLLCPIARALDRIGDRWTLLILRDLHAGPARFSDLQHGLTGIAANLLTDRLNKLSSDGLITKTSGAHGAALYELTALGARTRDIIFELALFGGRFQPEAEIVAPGNLRTVAVTLGAAAQRVVRDGDSFEAGIIVDGQAMCLSARNGKAEMLYQPAKAPDLVLNTSYAALLAVAEGEMDLEEFARHHSRMEVKTPGKDVAFMALMAAAMALMQD